MQELYPKHIGWVVCTARSPLRVSVASRQEAVNHRGIHDRSCSARLTEHQPSPWPASRSASLAGQLNLSPLFEQNCDHNSARNRSVHGTALQNSQQFGHTPLAGTKNPYSHNSVKNATAIRPVTPRPLNTRINSVVVSVTRLCTGNLPMMWVPISIACNSCPSFR
jgi:hypothetical protein